MSAVPITLDATEAPAPDTAMSSDADSRPTHSAHPDALRLRAVSLWCEGIRSPAIATQLGVPERTVRSWLDSARAAFQAEQGETAQQILALAVERQLAIAAAAAWQSYHHAMMLEQLALDYHRALAQQAHDEARELPPPPPRPSTAPARYLSVALAAQREAARLSGCYDMAKAMAVRQVQPQPRPLSYAETRGLDPNDERAWDGFLRQRGLSPARFAGPADLDDLYRPAWEALRRKLHAFPPADAATTRAASAPWAPTSLIPARTATTPAADRANTDTDPEIPAETATAPRAPTSLIGKGAGGLSQIPAKTATTRPSPGARGAGGEVAHSAPPHAWQHIM